MGLWALAHSIPSKAICILNLSSLLYLKALVSTRTNHVMPSYNLKKPFAHQKNPKSQTVKSKI